MDQSAGDEIPVAPTMNMICQTRKTFAILGGEKQTESWTSPRSRASGSMT